MDLLIFSGQSNMQGQTEADPCDEAVNKAAEYRLLTDEIVELMNPVGEDIEDLLLSSHLKRGSLVPYFCDEYIKTCGNEVLAVHTAKGATILAQWLDHNPNGAKRYGKMLEKIRAAQNKVGKIDRKYFIWLQGESDACAKTDGMSYIEGMIRFKNNLKRDIGIDKFMIICVGYFATHYVGREYDEVIMNAQLNLPNIDPDFIVLTDITRELSLDDKWINPEAVGHYNNAAMRVIGVEAGRAAGNYTLSDMSK